MPVLLALPPAAAVGPVLGMVMPGVSRGNGALMLMVVMACLMISVLGGMAPPPLSAA
jgi:hypothetical protein